jgi:hypothetical protein
VIFEGLEPIREEDPREIALNVYAFPAKCRHLEASEMCKI